MDEEWVRFLAALGPDRAGEDLDVLPLLRRLSIVGWIDATTAAPDLQRARGEATAAIRRLEESTHAGRSVITQVSGVPAGSPRAWRLTYGAEDALHQRLSWIRTPAGRAKLARGWATARGRISSTELADPSRVAVNHAGTTLRQLEEEGTLAAGRPSRTGRGFFYVPSTTARP